MSADESSETRFGAHAEPASALHARRVSPWARMSIGVRLVLIATIPQLLYTNVMTWLGSSTLREAQARLSRELSQYPAAISALRDIYSEDQKLVFVLISLLLGTVSAVLAWRMAGKIRDSLLVVRTAAVRIASGDLSTEVGLTGEGEVGKLADALDELRKGLARRIELERHAAELEKDLALAATVESLFLPHEHGVDVGHARVVAAHRAAARVSGDFWHAERLPDGSLWIALGDVAGSGPGPAMIAAAVLTHLRVLRRAGVTEGEALVRGAHALIARSAGDRHPTSLCLVHVPASGPLRYTSAGALPPVLRHKKGAVLVADTGGRALSSEALEVSTHELELAPGDKLALFTSGLAQLDPDASATGCARALLATHGHKSPAQLCEHIDVLIAGRRSLAEDVTLLVLERPESAS